ncbi:hypothetical protein DDIC_03050 [Desulfovibrio desulfuricans]|uniref:Lipoprotein n=1 Tax=Desulfovibrio desulfuricans TaxID=876 RepID=A0A4P7UJX9_DESDE|nr:hypothetical protein [Desulfovibrio desulfuricans]QCC84871.1 hypothetical protein DDIC_03050 [Desulfovibrio desulfuricans]
MQSRLRILLLPALCLLVIACACSRRPTSTADVPRVISPSYVISVAPFTQPINASQLITGHIPENQGRIADEMLPSLDRRLQSVLTADTKRQYKFINSIDLPKDLTRFHSSEQPQALPLWIAYGKKQGAQLLLVPQVLDWHEREGSTAGVTEPAHVRVEFFLINIANGYVMSRSVFEERQEGLADNLLNVGTFFKRHGQWVTAEEMSVDGMHKAVKDMNL